MSINIFLIEDHDEALKVWRNNKIKSLDLVHIDAHIDFGYQQARPVAKVLKEARSLEELKRGLEQSIAFTNYESDFEKQTNIGNYIYPAMEEGIVRNFYWVIPGGIKEFRESRKLIRNIINNILHRSPATSRQPPVKYMEGIISTELLGRKFTVCILEKLPIFKQKLLLDIDTDFLVVDSLSYANNTSKVGKRKPWILPQEFVSLLKERIINPQVITVAYSVNGGYTPMMYKHLGDEVAYYLSQGKFKGHWERAALAARHFNNFHSAGKIKDYKKAIRLNPSYRVPDNNYGPLFLALRKFTLANKEFKRILKVDPKNPACLFGLGSIAAEERDFKKAKRLFSLALRYCGAETKLFSKQIYNSALLGLARAEFSLKNFKKAKGLLRGYLDAEPMQAYSYYLLGRIFEREHKLPEASAYYQDAVRLGFGSIELLERLLRISYRIKAKDDIINFIRAKYEGFKRGFLRAKALKLKKGEKKARLKAIKRIKQFEKKLKKSAAI